VTGLVRLNDRVSFLGELRSGNLRTVEPFALYARVRPFSGRRLDIQIGRIPPTFGSFARRTYGHDNPLIGLPLAYQYLTSLRADVAPGDADELLRMRGRGWLSNFTYGNIEAERGVPLVSALTWDTGVQVTTGWKMLSVAAAVTNGTASNPRVADDNSGKQIAARVSATPATGLVLATSYARGEFLGRGVRRLLGPAADGYRYAQRAHGADVEYSRDRWLVRADAVFSEWQMPLPADGPAPVPLRAVAMALEGRYTFLPGFYGAARAEHLAFSRIAGATHADEWDAPVTRVEIGGGYYLQRNLSVRLSLQSNWRDGGRISSQQLAAAQLLYWF
jgi:predicted porin